MYPQQCSVSRKESEVIFQRHLKNPIRGDQMEAPLEGFSISINLAEFTKQSKEVFKKKVGAKTQEYNF